MRPACCGLLAVATTTRGKPNPHNEKYLETKRRMAHLAFVRCDHVPCPNLARDHASCIASLATFYALRRNLCHRYYLYCCGCAHFCYGCYQARSLDDFHVVYSGARAMLDHAEIDAATHRMYIYSPFVAFVFQPLALLPEHV